MGSGYATTSEWGRVVATTTQVTLTVLTKAEIAQKSRSDVEFEPAMATAKAEDIATQAEETQNTLHT